MLRSGSILRYLTISYDLEELTIWCCSKIVIQDRQTCRIIGNGNGRNYFGEFNVKIVFFLNLTFASLFLCVSNKSLFKNRKYETQQNLEQLYFLPFFYLLTIMMQLRRDVWCLSRMNDSKTCENRFSVRTELIFTFTVAIYSKSRVRMIRYQVK